MYYPPTTSQIAVEDTEKLAVPLGIDDNKSKSYEVC